MAYSIPSRDLYFYTSAATDMPSMPTLHGLDATRKRIINAQTVVPVNGHNSLKKTNIT